MTTRRKFLTAGAAVAAPAVLGGLAGTAQAGPNGTRPTILTGLSVTATSTTKMRVLGRYTTLAGGGIAGLRVDIYAVTESSFSRWTTVYTNNTGNFDVTTNKVPVGSKIQIVVDGNGAYSQPFPTFSRV